jgi:hypothetical protein
MSETETEIILLPGFMGVHLKGDREGRVWLDFGAMLRGDLAEKLALDPTGAEDAIAAFALALGAAFQKGAEVDGSYAVDHTAAVFLVGPEARLVAVGDGHARVDLAFRRHGGWVLTLVRRGEVGLTALAQLERSLDVARDAIAVGDDTIEGLLVAERAAPELVEVLDDRADVRFTDVATLLGDGMAGV